MKVISIKENHIFRRLYAKGKSAATPCVAVYCRRNGKAQSRLGITVSTKLGKAVHRNKVRRRIREIYRLHQAELLPGWDIVVVARVKASHSSYAAIERSFLSAMDKLGLRQKEKEA